MAPHSPMAVVRQARPTTTPSTATPASPMSFHTIMVMSSAWLAVCGTTLAEVAPK